MLAEDTCPSKNSSKHSIHFNNGNQSRIDNNKIMPRQIRRGYCLSSSRKSSIEAIATVRTWVLINNWARRDCLQISRIKPRNSMDTWWRPYPSKPRMPSKTSRATDMAFHSHAMRWLNQRTLRVGQTRTTITLPFKVSQRSAIVITWDPNKHCKILQIIFSRSRRPQIARRNSGRTRPFQSSKGHSKSKMVPITKVRINLTTPKSR